MIEAIAGILIAAILTGGMFIEKTAEKELRKEIGKIIPAERIYVDIDSSFFQIFRGKIKNVEIVLERFDFEGLMIEKFRSKSSGIKFSPGIKKEIEIKEIKETKFEFEIKEDDLNNFLRRKVKAVKNFKVDLKKNKFNISFYLLNVEFPVNPKVEIEGRIFVFEGDKIYLDIPRVKVGILRIPQFIIDILVKEINPVFNIKNFEFSKILFIKERNLPGKFSPEIEKIEIKDRMLKVEGEMCVDKNKK